MLDWNRMADFHTEFWNDPDRQEHDVNTFDGEWQISDHSLIPQVFHNFIMEKFPKKARLKDVAIDEVNRVLNEAWEGPGSVGKVIAETHAMQAARRANQ